MAVKIESKALRMLKPGYTPQKSRDIKAYAKAYCNDLIDILYDIASDEENFPRDRIQAAEAVLNRAYGKPGNAPDEDEFEGVVNVERMSTQQLTKMLTDLNGGQPETIVDINPVEVKLLEAALNEESREVQADGD